jgi:hypothetical protein
MAQLPLILASPPSQRPYSLNRVGMFHNEYRRKGTKHIRVLLIANCIFTVFVLSYPQAFPYEKACGCADAVNSIARQRS